jgi:hypothetical protein
MRDPSEWTWEDRAGNRREGESLRGFPCSRGWKLLWKLCLKQVFVSLAFFLHEGPSQVDLSRLRGARCSGSYVGIWGL